MYDANGNVVVDLNKNVQSLNNGAAGTNGISYNYLDKPDQINLVGKGVIKIVYDADGNKLQRTYTATGSTVNSVTTYVKQFVYTETVATNNSSTMPLGGWGIGTDTLRYFNFEEGRIRLMQPVSQGNGFDALVENGNLVMPNNMMGVYDYFIMDYQKNVRMILTEETHQSSGTATMETTRAAIEDGVFGQQGTANEVEATRYSKPAAWTANTSASVSRLGNIAGHNLGPNTLQKVMAGDQVSAVVQYYHQAAPASASNNLVTNIIGNLVSLLNTGGVNLSNLVKSNAANIAPQINSTAPPYIGGLSPQNPLATAPKAYLTILFFDERFNFIAAADGGSVQQQVAATVDGNGAQIVIPNVKAPKNGYTYVYVSNQSDQDVYFDNLQVGITAGNITEENHYYAYGLKIAGISSKKLGDSFEGMLKNNNLYNDKEFFDDGDLNWYDYGFRNYDPQIGKFTQLDPLTWEFPELTNYQYASNDPITNIDLDGLEGVSSTGLTDVVVYASRVGNGAAQVNNGISKVLSATSLALSAIKISSSIVRSQLVNKTINQGLSNPIVQQKLTDAVFDFYKVNQNNISVLEYTKLLVLSENYYKGLNLMAWWSSTDFNKLDRTVIEGGEGHISDSKRVALTEAGIQDEHSGIARVFTEGANTALFISSLALFPEVGSGPRAPFSSKLQQEIVGMRSLNNPFSLKGATLEEVESLIPNSWTRGPLNKGEGIKFMNPAKKGEQILLEKGWPGAKDPLHAGPYMKISRNGTVVRVPLFGNPTL